MNRNNAGQEREWEDTCAKATKGKYRPDCRSTTLLVVCLQTVEHHNKISSSYKYHFGENQFLSIERERGKRVPQEKTEFVIRHFHLTIVGSF